MSAYINANLFSAQILFAVKLVPSLGNLGGPGTSYDAWRASLFGLTRISRWASGKSVKAAARRPPKPREVSFALEEEFSRRPSRQPRANSCADSSRPSLSGREKSVELQTPEAADAVRKAQLVEVMRRALAARRLADEAYMQR